MNYAPPFFEFISTYGYKAGKIYNIRRSPKRKFILKLQENWAYRKEYNEAEGRLERLVLVT